MASDKSTKEQLDWLKFNFKLLDQDGDGLISVDDICKMEKLMRTDGASTSTSVSETNPSADGASTSKSVLETNPSADVVAILDEKEEEEDRFEYAIIGYFLERYPMCATEALEALAILCCSYTVSSKIYLHPSGCIVFQFRNQQDRDALLSMAPQRINGCLIHLLEMPPSFDFTTTEMTKVSVWVKLPGLDCWTRNVLSRIAMQIGRLISIDNSTQRLFIEVDLSSELVHSTKIKHPTKGIMDQPVVYETLPNFCKRCVQFGHTLEACLFGKPFIAPEVLRKEKSMTLWEAAEALNAKRRKAEALREAEALRKAETKADTNRG